MKVFSFVLVLVCASIAHAEEVGLVTQPRGIVRVDGKLIKDTVPLSAGSIVETGEGKCTLLLGKETVVHLDRGTRFEVKEYLAKKGDKDAKAAFDLKYGRVRALIKSTGKEKKEFQFRTKAAVMGVRGTHVVLDVPRAAGVPERFVTLEGVAEVSFISVGAKPGEEKASPPVQVRENQSLRVAGSAPSGGESARAPQGMTGKQAEEVAARIAPPARDVNTTREVRAWIEQGPPPMGFGDFNGEDRFRRPPGPPQIPFDPVADGVRVMNFTATLKAVE